MEEKRYTLEEAMDALRIDKEDKSCRKKLAKALEVGESAISNWVKGGRLSMIASKKVQHFVDHGVMGSNNNIHTQCSHKFLPEVVMLQNMLEHWDERSRKKLMRLALELDEEIMK